MARDIDKLKAKQLYTEEGKDVKEISSMLGVPEKTVYRWKSEAEGSDDDWDRDREAIHLTGHSAYKRMLAIAVKQLSDIAVSGEIDPRKADALQKVIKSAKSLAKDMDRRGNILLGMTEFTEFLRESHADQLETLQPFLIEFGTWVKKKYP